VLARDARDRQPRALPEVVVIDLGDGGAEAMLELCFGRLDVLALALERAGLREMEVDGEDADIPGAHAPATLVANSGTAAIVGRDTATCAHLSPSLLPSPS
jgi:hypothetical protein